MFEGWQPDEVSLAPQLKTMGIQPSQITAAAVTEFVSYWITQSAADTQAAWCRKLVLSVKNAGVRAAAEVPRASRQSRPTTSKHTGLNGQDLVSGLEANPDGTFTL
ncbi:DnaT DNA-binding domain protein [compost metagenome]